VRWLPLWPDHENFLQATLYEKCVLLFFSRFRKKMGEFVAFIKRLKAKSVSASGGLRPLTPLGAPLPDLPYRLALCALSMSLPLC